MSYQCVVSPLLVNYKNCLIDLPIPTVALYDRDVEGNMLKPIAIYSIQMKYVLKWTLLLIYYPCVNVPL